MNLFERSLINRDANIILHIVSFLLKKPHINICRYNIQEKNFHIIVAILH